MPRVLLPIVFALRQCPILICCLCVCNITLFAQQSQWNYSGTTTACIPANATWDGRVGIGFNNPQSLLHVHSMYCTTNGLVTSAIERLQTYSPEDAFGVSSFQFWSNSVASAQDWMVGAIQPITKGLAPFNGTNTGNWFGGLAFYCSGSNPRPLTNDKIEVMRLYDRRVAINSETALGTLDIMTSPLDAFKNRIVFDNGYECVFTEGVAKHNYGPRIKLYRPTGSQPNVEFANAMSAWINLEFDLPSELGYSRFNIFTNSQSRTIGQETETEMRRRLSITGSGNIGIGQIMPDAKLHITNGALLVEGNVGGVPQKWTFAQSPNPADGDCVGGWSRSEFGHGTRFMWVPEKAAIRAGKLNLTGTYTPPLAYKFWENTNIGIGSIAMGEDVRATPRTSGAFGATCVIKGDPLTLGDGHSSFALGHDLEIMGSDVLLGGYDNVVTGDYSAGAGTFIGIFAHNSFAYGSDIVIGDSTDEETAKESFAAGRYIQIDEPHTITLGHGSSINVPLVNDVPFSFMVGFKSNLPTLYVGKARGQDLWGGVGIATTEPLLWRLRVNTTPKYFDHDNDNTTANIPETGVLIGRDDWLISGSPPAPSDECDLAVQRKVGIGTPSPQEALSVVGTNATLIVADNNTFSVSDAEVSLAVEEKAIIGGNAVLVGREDDSYKLHVHGDAAKLNNSAWNTISDGRYKQNVHSYTDGLGLLHKIRPVWFEYNGKFGIKSTKPEIGIIAQEIEKILPYTVSHDTMHRKTLIKEERRYQVDVLDTVIIQVPEYSQRDEHGHYRYKDSLITKQIKKWIIEPAVFKKETEPILTYNANALWYLLVNGVKELDSLRLIEKNENKKRSELLSNQIVEQKITIDSLKLIINNQENRITRLEARNNINSQELADIILEQNNPNPFSDNTVITYFIPSSISGEPTMIITPYSRTEVMQTFTLQKGIPTQLTVTATNLETGVYVYSIVIAGNVVASKKFIIIK